MRKALVILTAAAVIMAAASGCDARTESLISSTTQNSSGSNEGNSGYTEDSSDENSSDGTSSDSQPQIGQSSEVSDPQNGNTSEIIGSQIAVTAESLVGIDFAMGKASPEEGFDNSGLIYYVLRENGYINCPRGTEAQLEMGTEIDFDDIQAGDLAFFSERDEQTGDKNFFGGIYISDGRLIYSPYPGEKVKYADINSSYWKNAFYKAVRVS